MFREGDTLMSALNGMDLTALEAAASSQREIFQAYVKAGFSEFQACVIIGTWLAALGSAGTETND